MTTAENISYQRTVVNHWELRVRQAKEQLDLAPWNVVYKKHWEDAKERRRHEKRVLEQMETDYGITAQTRLL